MSHCIAAVVLLLVSTAIAASPHDFVVAPTGNDTAAGNVDAPFATLSRAIRAVRDLRSKSPTKPITVLIRGGHYELSEPIRFEPADSGSAEAPITYENWPGETPIFTGGRKLTGWKVMDAKWELSLPEVKDGKWNFSQLFVNNTRRFRPRPAGGKYLRIAGDAPTNEAFKGEGDNRFIYNTNDIDPKWKNAGDIEVLTFHRWTMSRLPVDSIDAEKKIVSLRGRTGHNIAAELEKGGRYLIENVAEALDAPGEFYLDRPTGVLRYMPDKGEDAATAEVFAPHLEKLVSFEGDTKSNKFVSHITLRGLTFRHTNWTVPRDGHSTGQAEMPIRGAIRAQGVNFITLDRITVSHIGTYAIDFSEACADCIITNCDIYDTGAGGIRAGTGWDEGDSRERISSNFTITNNRIHGIGRTHPGAIGIWIGHSPHNLVAHNEIFDTYYTGISIGWHWGERFSWAHHNTIRHNLIHHVGQGRLDDLAGIYTLGESPGTVLSGNHIYESRRLNYCGNGIYLDEGSARILVEKNYVHDCDDGAFFMHYGAENIVRNNILTSSKHRLVGLGRPDKSGVLTLTRNILLPSNPLIFEHGIDDQNHFDHNLYFCPAGPIEFHGKLNFDQWQKSGRDEGSLVDDPKLDATCVNNPASQKLGFQPFDVSNAGREKSAPPLPATQPVAEGFPAP